MRGIRHWLVFDPAKAAIGVNASLNAAVASARRWIGVQRQQNVLAAVLEANRLNGTLSHYSSPVIRDINTTHRLPTSTTPRPNTTIDQPAREAVRPRGNDVFILLPFVSFVSSKAFYESYRQLLKSRHLGRHNWMSSLLTVSHQRRKGSYNEYKINPSPSNYGIGLADVPPRSIC